MVKKSAIVFIDANNWYHNVKNVINPGDIDIKKLCSFICDNNDYKLKQIRWYASIPCQEDGKLMYYKHMSFLEKLKKMGILVITRKLQRNSNEEILNKKKDIIESLDLCNTCRPLVKENCETCVGSIKKREKGIDVWVAIDMIRKSLIENKCDCCILISGDSDFVPALNLIKKHKKDVLSCSVHSGYAYELRNKFKHFILSKPKLLECIRDYEKR